VPVVVSSSVAETVLVGIAATVAVWWSKQERTKRRVVAYGHHSLK
jgi:hypothetical protein